MAAGFPFPWLTDSDGFANPSDGGPTLGRRSLALRRRALPRRRVLRLPPRRPRNHTRRNDRIVLDQARWLRQWAATDSRPPLLGNGDDEGHPNRGDDADDADAGAARPHEEAVADQVGHEERAQGRLSDLGEHLYVHRPKAGRQNP